MDEAMIQFLRIKTAAVDIYTTYPDLCAVGAVIVLIGILGWTLHKAKRIPGEEIQMKKAEYVISKRQRKQRIHTLLADGFGDVLLTLLSKGEINQEEYQRWHMRLGTQLALKDMLPQPLTPELVKASMKKRIGNGVYKPVHIPGPPIRQKHYATRLEEILATAK